MLNVKTAQDSVVIKTSHYLSARQKPSINLRQRRPKANTVTAAESPTTA